MMERSEIRFGLTKIPFDVRRSARRKTVALAVDASGELTVTAPPHVPLARLNDVVRTKATWVVQRSKRASDRPPATSSKEWVTGETVLYLGRQHRLRLAHGVRAKTALKGGWLHVHGAGNGAAAVRRAVAAWLRQRAEHYLAARLVELCTRHDLETPLLVIGEQRARWGSCDARGTLRLNWRIIQAPVTLIDYVVLHELTHLEHPSHDRAFWAALGRSMPDYEARRDRLRVLGAALVW
jgi:predicted metal-dependent hydrolase